MKKVIFHIDVNSAFLSWEAVYRLHHLGAKTDLREQVSAVGGDVSKRHGIILAKSIPAKKYKIKTGESVMEALQKCPTLQLVPPNYSLYERCSKAFMEILREYTPIVEQYSIDEAYMDMTGCEHLWGEPEEAAHRIKEHIKHKLGFTVNIGISENKLLAKMASDFEKPDKVHTLWVSEIQEKMWPLPVSELFFVGRASNRVLQNLGIRTIGDLAKSDCQVIRSHLKKHGEIIWQFANGVDISPVLAEPEPNKGYGNSTTIAYDVTERDEAKKVLLALAETVGMRLREANVRAQVLAIGIKNADFQSAGHQRKLKNATNITSEIYKTSAELFDELWDGSPIRHLGIYASRVTEGAYVRQLCLFEQEETFEKKEKLDKTVDSIRKRYGIDAIKRACFLEGKIDHLSGGISREKRTVDYSKIKIDS